MTTSFDEASTHKCAFIRYDNINKYGHNSHKCHRVSANDENI